MPEEPECEHVMVCTPAENLRGAPISGSVKNTCATCNKAVWVSPSSHAILQSKQHTRIICCKCADKEMGADDYFEPLSEEQIKELKARMEH